MVCLCLVFLCFFGVCALIFFLYRMYSKVVVLKRQLQEALWERDTLSRHRDSLIRQRDRAYWQRGPAVLRVNCAEQRYRTLVWVVNVEPAPVEEEGGEDEGFASLELEE